MRFSSTSRTVSPSASTWRLLPASGRRTGGMRTVGTASDSTGVHVLEAVDRSERREDENPDRGEPDRDHAARDDRGRGAEERGCDAGLEGAELVRRAEEDHLDREHAAAELVRRRERERRRADVHADHVDEAAHRESSEREREGVREPEDDHAGAEGGDDEQQRVAYAPAERAS